MTTFPELDAKTRKNWLAFCRRWGLALPDHGACLAEVTADPAGVIALAHALGRAAADAWLDGKLDLG